jgi:rhodanese-related sulfurtransferase
MEDLGFVEVYMISDGLDAWEGAGLPVVIE